jgi:hypothetical protein
LLGLVEVAELKDLVSWKWNLKLSMLLRVMRIRISGMLVFLVVSLLLLVGFLCFGFVGKPGEVVGTVIGLLHMVII